MLQKSVSLDSGASELAQAPERTFSTSGTRPRGVSPAEIRPSLLTLEPVVLPRPAKLRDFTRLQLMAAGCAAALASYGITAWGSELYAADGLSVPQRVETVLAQPSLPIDAIIAMGSPLPLAKPTRARPGKRVGASLQPIAAVRVEPLRAARREQAVALDSNSQVASAANGPAPAPLTAEALASPSSANAAPVAVATAASEPHDQPRTAAPDSNLQPTAAAPQPAVRATTNPVRVSIQQLSVRGSLPASTVRHGLERIRAQLARCTEPCAQLGCAPSRWHTELAIDEVGRTRKALVSGPAEVGRCLEKAAGKLATAAPDTGTVRVSWDLQLER
jgi:hypothetical protein